MALSELPPALALFLGALAIALLRGRAVVVVGVIAPLIALAHSWYVIAADGGLSLDFLGAQVAPVHVHAATAAFATIFCLAAAGGALFAFGNLRRAELSAAMAYAGGALGVVFSGDLLSMLIFWEIMLLGSTAIIWLGGQRASYGAGLRYFALHAMGGLAILAGVIITWWTRMQAGHADPLAFTPLTDFVATWSVLSLPNVGAGLILLGMLVCAGAPPFSAWIADAYPEASPAGSVFLSAFTTKTAVFALIVAFAGLEPLVWIGLYMALYGIIYAVLENDIRRVLAYSIVNQLGLMLVAVGIGTPLAIDGATAHAFSHIIYKGLLMMSAGSVLLVTGRRKLTELGGLYRTMPLTAACCVVGALAISAFPLTSGFTTKSMIDESVAMQANALALAGEPQPRLIVAWFVLLLAPAGVFLHAWIVPWFAFFGKDSGLRPPKPPRTMRAAMVAMAVLCIVLGAYPDPLYAMLPHQAAVEMYAPKVYTAEHVVESLSLLMFSGLAFFILLPMLQRRRTATLDVDWAWRWYIPRFWEEVVKPVVLAFDRVRWAVVRALRERAWLTSLDDSPVTKWLIGARGVAVPMLLILLLLLTYLSVSMFNL